MYFTNRNLLNFTAETSFKWSRNALVINMFAVSNVILFPRYREENIYEKESTIVSYVIEDKFC